MADEEGFLESYRRDRHRKRMFVIASVCIIVVAFSITLSVGKYRIGVQESYEIIWKIIVGDLVDRMDRYIVWESRLPRAITAITVGAGLAAAGCAMQYMMRNPLADPYTTGISSGAGLGASLAIVVGFCIVPGIPLQYATIVNAFLFSLIPTAVILVVTRLKRIPPVMMILMGVGIMYLFSAVTTLVSLMASPDDLAEVYQWNVGTLGKAEWSNVPFTVAAAIAGIGTLCIVGRRFDIVSLDEKVSSTLGEDASRVRTAGMVVLSLMTAVLVCFTGTIGFVGLVAPHIARRFVSNGSAVLLPASACIGAALLECADCVAKVLGSAGLPVGIVMSMVGGPLFLYILLRSRRGTWR